MAVGWRKMQLEQIRFLEKREKEILEELELGFSIKSLEEELYETRDSIKKLKTAYQPNIYDEYITNDKKIVI
jgi:DNA-binding NarL/FixJ family response regulator